MWLNHMCGITYEWCHIWIIHVTHRKNMSNLRHQVKWHDFSMRAMTYSCVTSLVSDATHMDESHHKWYDVMPHIWVCLIHVTHQYKYLTHAVMTHPYVRDATHMDMLHPHRTHPYEWHPSIQTIWLIHIQMCGITHISRDATHVDVGHMILLFVSGDAAIWLIHIHLVVSRDATHMDESYVDEAFP